MLAIPLTYMNESGLAVAPLVRRAGLEDDGAVGVPPDRGPRRARPSARAGEDEVRRRHRRQQRAQVDRASPPHRRLSSGSASASGSRPVVSPARTTCSNARRGPSASSSTRRSKLAADAVESIADRRVRRDDEPGQRGRLRCPLRCRSTATSPSRSATLTKSYGATAALRGIDFEVRARRGGRAARAERCRQDDRSRDPRGLPRA